MDVLAVIAVIGGIALLVGILGGEIEVEKIRIPPIPVALRIISSITGVVLIAIALLLSRPDLLPLIRQQTPQPAQQPFAITQQSTQQISTPQAVAQATFAPVQGLLYDSFDNPAYDGKYNASLWSCGGCAVVSGSVIQNDDSLRLEINNGEVALDSLSLWPSNNVGYIQGRMKLQSTDSGGVNMILRATLALHAWQTSCYIQGSQFSAAQAEYGCDVYTVDNDRQYKYEYVTESFPVNYGDWHTARIELTPNTFELRFYLDGKLIGQHTPVDADEVKTKSLRASFGAYTDTHLIAHIDDAWVEQPR
jgi:hypothetical protein